jgi:hypothetical protein
VARDRWLLAPRGSRSGWYGFLAVLGPDEGHKKLEGAGERQSWPGADQGADATVAEAVCQVGANGGGDPCSEAPLCQGWHRVLAPVGVEDQHACRQDQTVHGKRDEAGGCAGLAMGGVTSS